MIILAGFSNIELKQADWNVYWLCKSERAADFKLNLNRSRYPGIKSLISMARTLFI